MLILLAAGLPVGCSRDAEPTMQHEIAVTTGVSGMQKRVVAINDDATLRTKDIKIDAYYHGTDDKYLDGVRLHYNTGHTPSAAWVFWETETPGELHYYWPFEGSKTASGAIASTLDFIGFCPFVAPAYITGTEYDAEDGVSFTCNMSKYMDLAGQDTLQEFLVAVSNEQTIATQTEHNGVPLQFKHPLAQVKFVITAASGTYVTIDSIGITDMPLSATCTYNGATMTWGSYSVETDTVRVVQTLKNGGTTETTPVYIIPASGTKYLVVSAKWTEWGNVTITNYGTDVAFDWEPGHSYTYNLTLDKYALKVDVEKYTEQW